MKKIFIAIILALFSVSYAEITASPFSTIGKASAPVTIYLYMSYACPHCADFYKNTELDIIKNYVNTGKVKFVSVDSPFGPDFVQQAHVATFAAKNSQQYIEFQKQLYLNQETWLADAKNAPAEIIKLGVAIGIKKEDLIKYMDNVKLKKQVLENAQKEFQRLGLGGTPSLIFVKGNRKPEPTDTKIVGASPYKNVAKVIDGMLK